MVNGTVNRTPGPMQANARSSRPGEYGSVSDRLGSEERVSNNTSLSQGFGAPKGWGASIWSNGNLGPFGSTTRDSSRTRENGAVLNTAPEVIDGKTGSGALVASSETDPWTRQRPQWGPPELNVKTNTNARSSGVSPSRSRLGSQAFIEVPQSASSYYQPSAKFPVGQQLAPKTGNQGVLDATPGALASSRQLDSVANAFSSFGLIPDSDGQRSATSTAAAWHDAASIHSPTEERRSAANSDYLGRSSASASRSGSLPPSRHGAEPFNYNQSPETYNAFPPGQLASSSRAPNPSISSQGGWSNNDRKDSTQADVHAAFSRLNLEGGNSQQGPAFHKPSFTMNGASPKVSHAQEALFPRHSSLSFPNGATNFDDGVQDYGNYTSDGFPNTQLADQIVPYRGPPRANDRQGSWTPYGNMYRQAPYYSTGSTPPVFDHLYPSRNEQSARVLSQNTSEILERKLRGLQSQQEALLQHPHYQQMLAGNAFRGQLMSPYPYAIPNGMQLQGFPSAMPIPSLPDMMVMETPKSTRELDYGQGIRSMLMEEFKSNSKTSRRYELKDIYDHFVEFSGDQHGSRFIQQKLETANSDEKERVFREIQPNALQLMQDVFGNYVIQKFFEHGDQNQKKILANTMKGRVVSLSTQMYGCRVVQKALEHVLSDQQASLVSELDGHVMRCVRDQNGNHVVQRAIQVVPAEHITFIINAFTNQVGAMAIHPYGCRVIQRMLEHCEEAPRRSILAELRPHISGLLTDQYGNYVSQHILRYGEEADRAEVINLVKGQLLHYSKHKHASNVVEHCLKWASDEQRRDFMLRLIEKPERGDSLLSALIKDGYGNYVIQTLLDTLSPPDYVRFTNSVSPELAKAKRTMAGKQIQHVEQKMHRFESNDGGPEAARHATSPPAISTDFPVNRTSTGAPPEERTPSSHSAAGVNDSATSEPLHGGTAAGPGAARANGIMSAI